MKKKVVIISENGYDGKYDETILSLLEEGCELISIVGKDCVFWENMIDELAVGNGENPKYVTTSSHPDETEEEVIKFAENWVASEKAELKIYRL
ncbi:MAG: hypothetical protein KTR16_03115 [Acidiferrobacterales bacterium]|nr:hypothetical protein [Acidiferrobacterales bacterium]